MTQLALRDVYTFAFAHKSTVPEAVMHNDTTSATGSSPRLNAPISVSTRFTAAVVSNRTGLCVLRTRHFLHARCCSRGPPDIRFFATDLSPCGLPTFFLDSPHSFRARTSSSCTSVTHSLLLAD